MPAILRPRSSVPPTTIYTLSATIPILVLLIVALTIFIFGSRRLGIPAMLTRRDRRPPPGSQYPRSPFPPPAPTSQPRPTRLAMIRSHIFGAEAPRTSRSEPPNSTRPPRSRSLPQISRRSPPYPAVHPGIPTLHLPQQQEQQQQQNPIFLSPPTTARSPNEAAILARIAAQNARHLSPHALILRGDESNSSAADQGPSTPALNGAYAGLAARRWAAREQAQRDAANRRAGLGGTRQLTEREWALLASDASGSGIGGDGDVGCLVQGMILGEVLGRDGVVEMPRPLEVRKGPKG